MVEGSRKEKRDGTLDDILEIKVEAYRHEIELVGYIDKVDLAGQLPLRLVNSSKQKMRSLFVCLSHE